MLAYSQDLTKTLGNDITKTMKNFTIQEQTYNNLLEQRAEIKTTTNKKRYKEIQFEIEDITRTMKDTNLLLTKTIKENPIIARNTTKVSRDRTDLIDLLLRFTQELRDHRTYKTILNKVDEELRATQRLQDLKLQEKSLREIVYNLQQRVQEEQTLSQTLNHNKKTEISQLRNGIRLIRTSASTNSTFLRKESHAQAAAMWRDYKLQEREMEIEVKECEERLKTEAIVCQV